jgi:PAS domain S-box-containing protein
VTYARFGARALRRAIASGLVFGAIGVTLMVARIQVSDGVFFDARSMPVALVALFEGWPAALIAGGMTVLYRLWLGGSGVPGGVLSMAGIVVAGALIHAWARRDGRLRPRHALALGVATFLASTLGFLIVGDHGRRLFALTWPEYFVADVIGITVLARLLHNVVENERLAAAQRRFRAIVDEASDAIRIVDPDTFRILEVNRMDCELSGYAREELIGRDARTFWSAPEANAGGDGVARAYGVPYRTRSGTMRSVDSTHRIVEHDGHRYEIVIFHDATARQAAEAAEREIIELRAVTMLASAAAHEINNPLTVVVGSLQLLRRKKADPEDARWMERALGSAERIREIIVRMNRITRVEAARSWGDLPKMLDIEKSSAARAATPPPTEAVPGREDA